MIDKKNLKDTQGRPLTQSLFLELGYNLKYAIFTLNDEDRKFKDKHYISLKKRFLEAEDVTEYVFANTWLLNWDHWKRLNANKLLTSHFEKWRFELELLIRSSAIQSIIEESSGEKGFQAAKWLASKGWDKRSAGRPSKEQIINERAIRNAIEEEFMLDAKRMDKLDGEVATNRLQ